MKLQDIFENRDTVWPNAIIIKNQRGRAIGEIYPIKNNEWGNFHYGIDDGYEGFDSKDDAFEELEIMHKEYVENKRQTPNPLVKKY
jgi:hypothetical protein